MEFEEIRIENTNRCSLNCFMCPRKLMTREKGRMSFDDFVLLCNKLKPFLLSTKLNWLDLHGYGEPLLDNELFKKIEYVSNQFPNVKSRIVTTLYNTTPNTLSSFLSCGLTEMVISHYATSEEEFKDIHGVPGFDMTRNNINTLLKLNNEKGHPIHILIENIFMKQLYSDKHEEMRRKRITSWHEQAIQWGAEIRNLSSPHNWGSAFLFKDVSSGICSIVNGYRKRILQITWDGKIIPCCFDYNADVIFGNIFKEDLEEVFSSVIYNKFLCDHKLNKLNNYLPCRKCSRCHVP